MNEEPRPACPKCGSALVQAITNGARCGQCGHQFNETKDVVGEAAAERKRQGVTGWKRADARTSAGR